MPSVAAQEPLGLALHIMEMRAYRRAHQDLHRYETASDDEDVELDLDDPALRLLWKVEEVRNARRRRQGAG